LTGDSIIPRAPQESGDYRKPEEEEVGSHVERKNILRN
jgi:hypothetical protein